MQTKQLSLSDLVENVVKLNFEDFETFLTAVNTRRAQHRPDVLSKAESDLLKKIYRLFPKEKKERLEFLNAKVWDETLTETERMELLKLVEAQEKWAAERMSNLAKLAAVRNTDYDTLIRQLGIFPVNGNE